MKKALAFLTALTLTAPAYVSPLTEADAAETSFDMNVIVDMAGETKAISPYIFGINQYGHQDHLKEVNATAIRQGGNRMTGYNWENNASNAGSDWQHSSDNNLSNSDAPADCVQELSAMSAKFNIGYKLTTLQLAGYVAADKDGTVTEAEIAPSPRWNEVVVEKGSAFDDEPDLTDGKVYMDEYINYIIKKLGDSSSATGIQGYSLDNEPALWDNTHKRMHPEPVSCEELMTKSIATAKAVKKLDPKAEVFGPALYGYTAFDHLDDDDAHDEWETIKSKGGYHWYLDYYLDEMKKASDKEGTRLLDVLDIHYYSESARKTPADRVQSVRTLYEKGFVEDSWIGQWCTVNIPILPTIQASIDKYYPGTKLAISEYNFEGSDDISGAIAQAEALGCFADMGVYFASLWGGESYTLAGFELYTNYDGKGGNFGDTLLPTVTDDVSKASAYASFDKDDDSTVTVMLTNKDPQNEENAVIDLKNSAKEYKSAAVYAVFGDSDQIRLLDIVNDISDNDVKVTLPAYSAAMVVVSDNADEFKGLKTYDQIKSETKTVTFEDIESMTNDKGYVTVPIEDPEHLVKLIITGDVSSSAGSSWGTAGCAVCINAKDSAGTGFWTSKSYTLGLGKGSTATVKFDGTLKNKEEEDIPAVIADGKVELQQWWDSSEKKEASADDVISVKYTKIQAVYEYTEEDADVLCGDANCDGTVDISDAVLIMQNAANPEKYSISEQGMLNADCVDAGKGVTSIDALAVQMVEAKTIKASDLPTTADKINSLIG